MYGIIYRTTCKENLRKSLEDSHGIYYKCSGKFGNMSFKARKFLRIAYVLCSVASRF